MGSIDEATRKYMDDPSRFADLFNFAAYGGEQVIQADSLRPLDSVSVALPKRGKKASIERRRDGLKVWQVKSDGRVAYAILGVENQAEANRAMPVRGMLYDALAYQDQVDELTRKNRKAGGLDRGAILSGLHEDDRLLPVATIVLHFGAEPWNGALRLHDLLDGVDNSLLQLVADYRINLVSPAFIADADFDKFATELGLVLGYSKYQKDKNALWKFVTANERFRNVGSESVGLINLLTDSRIEVAKGKEGVDMCQAIQDIRQEGVDEGVQQGVVMALAGLVRDGVLTRAEAASRAGLSQDEFEARSAELQSGATSQED